MHSNALQRQATVVVQKSLVEGFGLTVTEAMWKSRPFVASRVGGIQDKITNGRDGLLIDGARVLAEVVDHASVEERTDHGLIKEKLRLELRRFIRKRSGRRPLVLPVIMEI